MAALPSNNTERWFLDYVTGSHATATEHTMMIRTPTNTSAADVSAKFFAMLSGVTAANLWIGWRAIRLRWSAIGSNFSTPVTMSTALAGFTGTGAISGYATASEAIEVTAQGRSPSTGRRVDISLYGYRLIGLPTDFRLLSTVAWVNSYTAALNAGTPPLKTVDATDALWYPYVNLNFNSYWERRLRV